jgi:ABC-type lipopolysaccharide export system ATPase subunit
LAVRLQAYVMRCGEVVLTGSADEVCSGADDLGDLYF